MEGIVDSINIRFKCPWDEDSYRLIVALLNDGISVSQGSSMLIYSTWGDSSLCHRPLKLTSSGSQIADCPNKLRNYFLILN